MVRAILIAAWCAACVAGTANDPVAAFRKVESIERGRTAPGSQIRFTPAELNSWLQAEAKIRVPKGVRDVRLALGSSRATAWAMVDFVALRQAATGAPPGWIMQNLFAGERPVTVTARVVSRNGKARVDVERVEVSGVPAEGPALDFLIEHYVKPTFPAAKVAQWFELGYRLDRVAVTSAGVTAVVGR